MTRAWTVLPVAALLLLTGCAPASPNPSQSAAAAHNRPAAQALLARAPVELPGGAELIGDRTDDLCGSLTSDRGGFDDAHVEGYECVLVRRIVVVVPGSGYDEPPVTALGEAFAQANGYTSDAPVDGTRWHLDLSLDTRFRPIESGDTPLRVGLRTGEIPELADSGGVFPLYHRDAITVGHVGRLDDRSLATARAANSRQGLLIVLRYRYYNSYQGPR